MMKSNKKLVVGDDVDFEIDGDADENDARCVAKFVIDDRDSILSERANILVPLYRYYVFSIIIGIIDAAIDFSLSLAFS